MTDIGLPVPCFISLLICQHTLYLQQNNTNVILFSSRSTASRCDGGK